MRNNMHTPAPSLCLTPQNTFLNLQVSSIQKYPMPMKEKML